MEKLLEQLLAADVLNEDTKRELKVAFEQQLTEAVKLARADATAAVTAELNEQWITERETLIEAIDSKVTEVLTAELDELRESIEQFRDLEAEFATKLVESKREMADVLKNDVSKLIAELDTWLEIRLTAELDELREDVSAAKQNQFGRSIFEAFIGEFKKHYTPDNSAEAQLSESEKRLADAMNALQEAETKAARLERSIKMDKILSPISGRTKEVMEAILKNVETPLLEQAYATYIGRVMKEASKDVASEKEAPVLAEGKTTTQVSGVLKTGDDKAQLIEESSVRDREARGSQSLTTAHIQSLRRAAGLE